MRNLVAFRIQQLWFAVDAVWVEQILGQQPWMRVPSAPKQWPGVMAFRGRAVAVLDLAAGLTTATPLRAAERRHRTLIARVHDCTVAIPVDDVREVQAVDDVQIFSAHATGHHLAREEVRLEHDVFALLDLSFLITEAISAASSAKATPASSAAGYGTSQPGHGS